MARKHGTKPVKEHSHLDFDNYTRIENGYLLLPSPDDRYRDLPGIYDRVCSIIHFASKIGEKSDRSAISTKALSEAMTRAALSEFVALEDYITALNPLYKGVWFSHRDSSDPIFHMLKLLRNFNVHIDTSTLQSERMRVRTLINDKQYEIEKEFISNITLESLAKVHDSKFYLSILPQMIDVFEEQQRRWGIGSLIIKCSLDNMSKLDHMLSSQPQ